MARGGRPGRSTSRWAGRRKGIEFKRAHLYDINPVGVGAMGVASVLSIVAYLGVLGPLAQAFSALIALVTALRRRRR